MVRSDGSSLSKGDIEGLRKDFSGEVVIKGETDEGKYRTLIDRWNHVHITEANIIAICANDEDVSNVLKFAVKHDLDFAIAGGRHSVPGSSSCSGLVIDLRKIDHIVIDEEAKTVVAGGGCLSGDVEMAAEAKALMVGFGVNNETGIGGLTTGGGIGYLSSKYGLTLDNLISARVAVADGRVVSASEEENPDLFWGIRGGGSNFGIVTEFTYRAHEQGGMVMGMFPFAPDRLMELLDHCQTYYDEHVMKSDGNLTSILALSAMMPNTPHAPLWLAIYNGTEEEAAPFFKPIQDLGPLEAQIRNIKYTDATQFHKMMPLPPGVDRYYMSMALVDHPFDSEILMSSAQQYLDIMQKYGEPVYRSMWWIDLRDFTKVASVPVSATAFANRFNCANIGADFMYSGASLDETMKKETQNLMGNTREMAAKKRASAKVPLSVEVERRDVHNAYANFTSGLEKIESVFGENLPRLRELKKKWDPDMLFNKWFPIPPEEA